jgi:single-strand DNA-binding protein
MNSYKATGRLAQDPELRALPDGTPVCKLRLAVKGLARGEEEVGYINATTFGAPGEAAARVLTKGWLVAIDGRLEYHDWESKDGEKRRDWEVVGSVEFLAAPRSDQPAPVDATPDASAPAGALADTTAEPPALDNAQQGKPVEELAAA